MKLTENMEVEIRECIFKSMSECGCCGSYHPTYMDANNKYTYKRFMGMGCRNDTYRYHPDDMANLLFAAPELFLACKEMVAEWDTNHKYETYKTGLTPEPFGVTMAKKAISKATD